MTKSLYDEAIAEAKHLREIAEQNAKNAIIEAVTPKIREFIEDQLLQEHRSDTDKSEDNVGVLSEVVSEIFDHNDDEVVIDESALSSLIGLLGEDTSIDTSSRAVKNVLKQSADTLTESEKKKLLSAANKIKENANKLSSNGISIDGNSRERSVMSNRKRDEILYEVDLASLSNLIERTRDDDDDADMDEEMYYEEDDLEAALREAALVLDLGDVPEEDLAPLEAALGTAQMTIDYGEDDEDLEVDDEDLEDLEVLAGDEEFLEPEEDLEPMDEVFEIDPKMLKLEIRRLRRQLSEAGGLSDLKGGAKSMESQFGGSGGASAGLNNVWGGKSGKKGDAWGGGKREGDPFEKPPTMNKLAEVRRLQRNLKNEARRNRALQGKLNKYRSAVETLREQLTEMNLFNAKLLYVNKLLQNKGVSPSQRKSIVESIDGARTLREVKLLYKSLLGSIQKTKSRTISESTVRRSLGSASKATRPGSTQSGVAEVNRWATLAGLK